MKHKFTVGVITGMTALTAAVPLVAQIAGAQTASSATATSVAAQFRGDVMKWTRPAATQEAVQQMIQRDKDFLANVDALVTVQKSATQAHLTALEAAATITDDEAREAAVKKANEDRRTAVETAIEANASLKSAMIGFGGPGHHGKMMMKFDLSEKLGMTAEELKAAIDSGKTIEQIAEEKGVELPAKGAFKMRGPGHLAEKLGMTEDELKAAIESGKTIEQIATEKGVTLPARPMGGRGFGPMGGMMPPADAQ